IISRTKRTATIWVRKPRVRASPPKTSSNVNRTANMAPPGHPVPFTKPIGFLRSLIFGQPWARNKAPSAKRPMRAAASAYEGKSKVVPPRTLCGARDRKTFHGICRGVPRYLRERPFEEFRDVESPDVLTVLRLRGVVEHDQAVRACGRHRIRARFLDVAQTTVAHLLAHRFRHPHPRAAGAAAEPFVSALSHLDDPCHPIPIQGLDVRDDHGLREVLVPESTCGIPRAFLLGSQDRESHARPPEDPGEGLGDLPIAVIEGRGASDPIEDLDWLPRRD